MNIVPPKRKNYREKYREWISWLSSHDVHSITSQLNRVLTDLAIFKLLITAWEINMQRNGGNFKGPAFIQETINNKFFESIIMSIRRLTEAAKEYGDESIISLGRLIEDMKECRGLLKRKNIMEYHGYSFNHENVRAEYEKLIMAGQPIPNGCDVDNIKRKHAEISKIFRQGKKKISEADTVSMVYLNRQSKKLKAAMKRIGNIANKFIAHAASNESRTNIDVATLSVKIEDLEKILKSLCKVTSELRALLENCSVSSYLPSLPIEVVENIDAPLVNETDIQKLNESRKEIEAEFAKCVQ